MVPLSCRYNLAGRYLYQFCWFVFIFFLLLLDENSKLRGNLEWPVTLPPRLVRDAFAIQPSRVSITFVLINLYCTYSMCVYFIFVKRSPSIYFEDDISYWIRIWYIIFQTSAIFYYHNRWRKVRTVLSSQNICSFCHPFLIDFIFIQYIFSWLWLCHYPTIDQRQPIPHKINNQ
jgi:hypothetical protein